MRGLAPGADFGPRYRIEALLGEGGMGTVYKAYDKDLDRSVALKLLRPDVTPDAGAMQRFKQELLLATRISHKNILRIHDLGDAEGVKFISMAFVDGEDLSRRIRRGGRMDINQALDISRQLCSALEAAHNEGILHRDLKPQNVMMDQSGTAYITDFGLAKSLEAGAVAMTRAGEYLGTPRYMSPEQVEGKQLDQRSDLYSLGLIFYEMLTGETPFGGDSTLSVMFARVKQKVKSPRLLNPDVPVYFEKVVLHCLERDPERRYQHAREILADLEGAKAPTRAGSVQITFAVPQKRGKLLAIGGGVLALLLAVFAVPAVRHRIFGSPGNPAHAPVSVLVADFANSTGDSVFDETLEPPLSLALEDASFISSYNRNQARKIATQLQPGATKLDETAARLLGVREGITYVVTGVIEKKGNGYEVQARTLETSTGKIILEAKEEADDKKGVLAVVDKIAARTRRALGDSTPESAQLSAAGTFTTSSLEAAHAYALAQDLQWAGKWEEAIPLYEQAIHFDPNLGRAYAGLASTSANMGRRKDADKYYQLALAHIDRMSDREKYRTRGGYYLANREPRKAIEEYSALVQRFPSDGAGYSNLALAYFYLRDMPNALEQGRRAVELLPKALLQLNNLALYAVYAGDFATAADEARKVIAQNSSYVNAYGALAMAQTGQGKLSEAEQTYQKMETISARGAEMATMGQADLLLYQGRTKEAIALLQKAPSPPLGKTDDSTLAAHLILLAEAKLAAGKASDAAADAKSALGHDNGGTVQFSAGRIYIEAGQAAAAQLLASQLSSHLDPDDQAYAKLLEGEAYLKRGDARRAVTLFEEAQKLADTWMGRLDLGRAYIDMGAFTEADSELEKCLKRRGEASAVFLDDVPTFRAFPPTYYYLGRAQEGLKSPAAADSYKSFLSTKAGGDEIGLVSDAKKRLSSR